MPLPDPIAKYAWALNAQFRLRAADRLPHTVRLTGRPHVRNWRGTLVIGDRVLLFSAAAKLDLAVFPGARLEIGDRTFVNFGTSISAHESVRIGPDCHIGPHCMIMDNAFHHLDPARRNETPPSQPVTLESTVWLGARVLVLPGVTIGEGSVVGAGSVVTRDIPPGVLAAGMPARVLREL